MKLAGGNFPRQISRENAGRKSIWKNKDTITIRVPKAIAACRFQSVELQAWVLVFCREAAITYFHAAHLTLIYGKLAMHLQAAWMKQSFTSSIQR